MWGKACRVAKISGLVLGGALAAYLVLFPRVTYARAAYWLNPGGRYGALYDLVHEAPDGGWLELRHAIRSGNGLLHYHAACYLADKGDADGIRMIVEVHYESPYCHLKVDPHLDLRVYLRGDPRLDEHRGAEDWWDANGKQLVHRGDGRWGFRE
ncbi:MAG: hypothetical protein ACYS0K_18745 [Planctomycetota bacterium]|jgi:hypothetical protein